MRAFVQTTDSEKLIIRLTSSAGGVGNLLSIPGIGIIIMIFCLGFLFYDSQNYELLFIGVFLAVICIGLLAVGQMMRATAKADPKALEIDLRNGYLAFRGLSNQLQFQLPLSELDQVRRASRKQRTNKRGRNPQVYQEVWLDMIDGSQVCISSHLAWESPTTDTVYEALKTALAQAKREPSSSVPPQNLPPNYRLIPESSGALRIEWNNRFSSVILIVCSLLGILGLGFGLLTLAGMIGFWQGTQLMLAFGVFVGLLLWMGIRMRTRTGVLKIANQSVIFSYYRNQKPVGKVTEVPRDSFSGFFLSIQGTMGDAKLVLSKSESIAAIRSYYRGEEDVDLNNWRELFQMIRASQMLPIPPSRKIEMLQVWWAATLAARTVGVIGTAVPKELVTKEPSQPTDI